MSGWDEITWQIPNSHPKCSCCNVLYLSTYFYLSNDNNISMLLVDRTLLKERWCYPLTEYFACSDVNELNCCSTSGGLFQADKDFTSTNTCKILTKKMIHVTQSAKAFIFVLLVGCFTSPINFFSSSHMASSICRIYLDNMVNCLKNNYFVIYNGTVSKTRRKTNCIWMRLKPVLRNMNTSYR